MYLKRIFKFNAKSQMIEEFIGCQKKQKIVAITTTSGTSQFALYNLNVYRLNE